MYPYQTDIIQYGAAHQHKIKIDSLFSFRPRHNNRVVPFCQKMYDPLNAKENLHFIISLIILAAVAAASHRLGEGNHHDESRKLTRLALPSSIGNTEPDARDLFSIKDFADPKTISQKYLPRPINILVLGGLVLGGHHCRREEEFSSMLNTPNVDLVVYDYLSLCVDSTVPDVAKKNYDVILLNTNPNLEGFVDILLCCIDRFPEAVIISMQTWSYHMLLQGEGTSLELVKIEMEPTKEALITVEHGGYAYVMPRPKTVEEAKTWFDESQDGYRCVSHLGHEIVANGIGQLIHDHQQKVMKPKQLGKFRLVSEQHSHPHANNCFWTPGESDICINMLLQRMPKLVSQIRWFFIGDSTQRLLSDCFINHLNHANATYFFNRYASNEDHVDTFMETQSCQSGDLCVCIVNSGFWDMKYTGISDEEYIFNLRGYIQILRPFCKHLIWIPISSTLEDPKYPQDNQRTHNWNKLVENMLVSEPFDDWTSIVDSYKASTMFQHNDNVHLTALYYCTLAQVFDEVDRRF